MWRQMHPPRCCGFWLGVLTSHNKSRAKARGAARAAAGAAAAGHLAAASAPPPPPGAIADSATPRGMSRRSTRSPSLTSSARHACTKLHCCAVSTRPLRWLRSARTSALTSRAAWTFWIFGRGGGGCFGWRGGCVVLGVAGRVGLVTEGWSR